MTTWLHSLGAIVKGYALEATQPSLYNDVDGDKLCESIIADIRDKAKLLEAVETFQPDIIYHMAAQPLVLDAYNRPVYTFEVNTIGTANLLEAVKLVQKSVRSLILLPIKFMKTGNGITHIGKQIIWGYDPYSASKACSEVVTASYRSSFFNPNDYAKHQTSVATVRAGNVIGEVIGLRIESFLILCVQ